MGTPVHFRFSFRGVFLNTPEEWSFGLHYKRDNPADDDAHVGDINVGNVNDALAAFIQHSGSASFQPNVKATEWRAYEIGPDGKMENNPLLVDVTADNLVGIASLKYPPQCSIVATFVAANRGPARFGRIYLPPLGTSVGTDLRLSDGDAGEIRESVTDFVKAVADSIDLELTTSSELLNISEKPAPDGHKQTVDHIEVGRVYDTMRSRRRSMVEDRNVGGHIDW